jgi:hypothetical protein
MTQEKRCSRDRPESPRGEHVRDRKHSVVRLSPNGLAKVQRGTESKGYPLAGRSGN